MKNSMRTTIMFAVLIAAFSLITITGALAANDTNSTMTTTNSGSTTTRPYQPAMMSDGHQVFYVVFINNGDEIRPATATQRVAIDKAIADGSVKRYDHQQYLARDVQE